MLCTVIEPPNKGHIIGTIVGSLSRGYGILCSCRYFVVRRGVVHLYVEVLVVLEICGSPM